MEFDTSQLSPERQERIKEATRNPVDGSWQPSSEDAERIEVIMQLPWSVEITRDGETDQYIAYMPEAGVCSFGDTEEDARRDVYDALQLLAHTLASLTILDLLPLPAEQQSHAEG